MDWQNNYNTQNFNYNDPRIKYQMLLYKRREIEKKKKRRELLIRGLLISLIVLIIIYAYWWYSNNYVTNQPQEQLYSVIVDRTTVLQYDSLMTPYIVFNVQFKSNSNEFNVDEQDFSADISVSDYNYKVTKLKGGMYSVRVVFNNNNIPDEIKVKVKDSEYTVGIVKDVTLEVISIKAPNQTTVNENFKVYLYVQTSTRIDDWKVATNVKFIGGKVSESLNGNAFVYSFTLILNADKKVDKLLIKVYSKKYGVSKLIELKTKIVDKQTHTTFNLQTDKIMDDPHKDVYTKFSFIINTNYHDSFTIEYKETEHLGVDIAGEVEIQPGDNLIEGKIYLKKSVDEVRKENVVIVVKDSNGKVVDKRSITVTIFPSLTKIRVSPTPQGLTIDNWVKLSVDFYSQLKGVSAKILSCTAETDDGTELDCRYGEDLVDLEYNKITSTEVFIDTSRLVEQGWKGSVIVTINIVFYSQGVQFNKGVTIQSEIVLG